MLFTHWCLVAPRHGLNGEACHHRVTVFIHPMQVHRKSYRNNNWTVSENDSIENTVTYPRHWQIWVTNSQILKLIDSFALFAQCKYVIFQGNTQVVHKQVILLDILYIYICYTVGLFKPSLVSDDKGGRIITAVCCIRSMSEGLHIHPLHKDARCLINVSLSAMLIKPSIWLPW